MSDFQQMFFTLIFLTSKSQNPNIKNFTTVRRDRPQGQAGGPLIFIHKSINFHQQPQSPEILSDLHLEELTISAKLGNTELIISNMYIPPTSSCTARYQPSIDRSPDDDTGYSRTGRLQRTPLFLARNVNRYQRKELGRLNLQLRLRHPKLGHPN